MKERDARDSERDVAPLKAADDAFMLDTTDLDADAAFAATLAYLTSRMGRRDG
jgi:cytidylate kinase